MLVTLRDELLSRITERAACDDENHGKVSDKDLPSLTRELRAVLIELASLPSEEAAAPADEIARKRQARRQSAGQ